MSSNRTYDERVITVSFRCSTDLKDELDQIVSELDMTKREWLEAQIEGTKLDFKKAVEPDQERRADELESQIEAKDATIQRLRESISANTDKIHELQAERRSQEDRIKKLEDRLARKERHGDTVGKLYELKKQHLQESQDELEEVRANRARKQQEIEHLRSLLVDDIGRVARTVQAFEQSLQEQATELFHRGRVEGMSEIAQKYSTEPD